MVNKRVKLIFSCYSAGLCFVVFWVPFWHTFLVVLGAKLVTFLLLGGSLGPFGGHCIAGWSRLVPGWPGNPESGRPGG